MLNLEPLFQYYSQDHKCFRQQSLRWFHSDQGWQRSGRSLIDRVQPHQRVLDVGCARNVFRDHIANLVGIDPAYPEADLQVSFLNHRPEIPYDVIFALSVFNWGYDLDQQRNFQHMHDLLAANGRAFLRLNPHCQGKRAARADQDLMPYYAWTFDRVKHWSQVTGFTVLDLQWDYFPLKDKLQIYAELEKI